MFRSSVNRANGVSRIAFLLIFALLVHDGLMAAPASAAPSHETAVEHHASAMAPAGQDVLAEQEGEQRPGHPLACGVGQAAAPRAPHHAEESSANVASIIGFAQGRPGLRADGASGWQEPLWPPAVRRALIQIFRI